MPWHLLRTADGTMEPSSGWLGSVYATAEALGNITDPIDEAFLGPAWTYLTENYSKFTIAFWFSIVLHEVSGQTTYIYALQYQEETVVMQQCIIP